MKNKRNITKPAKPLIDEDGEVRELTAEDIALFRPAREVLPASFFEDIEELREIRRGRPKAATTKTMTSIRLDPELLAALRARGRGWQSEVNEVLKRWVARQAR